MARTKATKRKSTEPPLVTVTRFYLPLDQEWPMWDLMPDLYHAEKKVYAGPLAVVEGTGGFRVGRMIDNPEQAAYFIEWRELEYFKRFQSSPACTEFLRQLPESRAAASVVSNISSQLEHLGLDDASGSSSTETSRFLFLKPAFYARSPIDGVMTFTAFLLPEIMDSSALRQLHDLLGNMPFGPEVSHASHARWPPDWALGFSVLEEDRWAQDSFGAQPRNDSCGRAIFCHVFLWSNIYEEPLKQEQAAAADLTAQKMRQEQIAKVMPPAIAYVQERWNLRMIPHFWTADNETESEDDTSQSSECTRVTSTIRR
ncbi:hypothetical protein A9K55_001052 [Cordyceps militaris]|uniref:ABM domain-containing protein n=1 Tax=Cordyceps militaris TaxID=73501 RepID=A0A2H4SU35_CORMI|nr:hypothetical protein A9K55_001052 [Cordyceps militaris]